MTHFVYYGRSRHFRWTWSRPRCSNIRQLNSTGSKKSRRTWEAGHTFSQDFKPLFWKKALDVVSGRMYSGLLLTWKFTSICDLCQRNEISQVRLDSVFLSSFCTVGYFSRLLTHSTVVFVYSWPTMFMPRPMQFQLSLRCSTHCVSKNVMHLWFAITLTHVNAFWYFFGRNVIDKVSNQKTLYYATSINVCFCTTVPGKTGKHENRIFSFKYCISALPEFNQSLLDFFSLFSLTTHTHAAVWLPESCNQCVQLGAVGGIVQEKGSRERRSSWIVLHAEWMCTNALSSWKKKMLSVMCLTAYSICWGSNISH